ncbi:hypothetical protein [Runella sp.]|uniref:hypothetical protein n=1 Tax=Runella sp. TaxID=1960881 RepID=UPI003D15359F
MKIEYGVQIDPDQIHSQDIDIFIFAGNHEKRVYTSYDFVIKNNYIRHSIMFCYSIFKCRKQYKNVEMSIISEYTDIFLVLDKYFDSFLKSDARIFVDYSCMTKSWYYSIILYLSNKQCNIERMTVYFSYTPSKFSTPQPPKYNSEIAPLPGKYVVPTDKPKALIVCLGYEQNKAEGIIHHLDPKIYYIFYTKPALDEKFVSVLEHNNDYILNNSPNVTTFKFDDLLFLERELTSLYFSLRDDYSIVIAPLGPKPFAFVSMLLSVKYPDIDIWRVGSGSDINIYSREPINNSCFIISEMVWTR